MAWAVTYNSELSIIEIIYEGMANFDEMKAEEERSFALAKDHNTNSFLLDLKTYERSLSTIEIFNTVISYGDKIRRPMYIAVVEPLSEEARQDARFYETVCVNRGWSVETFQERREAIDWLVARGSQ